MPRHTLAFAALVLTLSSVGCAAEPTSEGASPLEVVGTTTAALAAFDPCNPDWQLPTWARHYLYSSDPTFVAFEDRLEEGGALWIGNGALGKPYRAIVRIDTFREFTKVDPHKALWYLAAIPASSKDARNAIDDFANVPPVSSRLLGACVDQKTFVRFDGNALPPNANITHYIVEYDPRCTCRETSHVNTETWVVSPVYEAMPTPRY